MFARILYTVVVDLILRIGCNLVTSGLALKGVLDAICIYLFDGLRCCPNSRRTEQQSYYTFQARIAIWTMVHIEKHLHHKLYLIPINVQMIQNSTKAHSTIGLEPVQNFISADGSSGLNFLYNSLTLIQLYQPFRIVAN